MTTTKRMRSLSNNRDRNSQLLLALGLFLLPSFATGEHTCLSGSGRIGDPLYYEEQTIPCEFLAQEAYAVLEYRLNLPVAIDFERQVEATGYATAYYHDPYYNATTNVGLSLQMTSVMGYPEDLMGLYSFLRKGSCSDQEVWSYFHNGTWTDVSSCPDLMDDMDCALTHNMTGDSPGLYTRLYVAVALDNDMECHGDVSVAVALQDAESDYKFSTDCLEVDRCFESPTPAPTWAPPDPPGNASFCEFDPYYAPSNIHRGPKPGKSTFAPLEVQCPPVNETTMVWFDIQLPTLPEEAKTSARISLAVSTGEYFNETDGLDFHGWEAHRNEEPYNKYCLLPNFNTQSKEEARFDNGWCPDELQTKLCHDDNIRGDSGSVHRVFGEVTNYGGCQGSLLFEATLVDKTVDENVDLEVYKYTSCSSPLAICENGDAIPKLPQLATDAPTPTKEYCVAGNDTKVLEPLILDCPPQGELATVVFDLWIESTLSDHGIDVLTVLSDLAANETQGLEVFFRYDTDYDPFSTSTCGNVPFFDGEPAHSIACPPEPNMLCTAMDAHVSPGKYIRYYVGILNTGGQCQGPLSMEVAVEDPENSVECRSAIQSCDPATTPTYAPTWYQPPVPESSICEFDPSFNRYGRNYPPQGLWTFPSLDIPSSCNDDDTDAVNTNTTNGNTTKAPSLVWFDFRMPLTGSHHHMAAIQLEVAVTAMDENKAEDLVVRIYTMPDYQQQNNRTTSCDEIEASFDGDYETGELDNWVCEGDFESPQTVCRSSSYNTYRGSVVRVFVSAFRNSTGCTGDLRFDATVSDISIASSEAPLSLYQRSECLQGLTQCFPGATVPEMTTWNDPLLEDEIAWDAEDAYETPSPTPSSSPTLAPATLVVQPAPTSFLTIPVPVETASDGTDLLLTTDTSEELPEATDASPQESTGSLPQQETSIQSSAAEGWNSKMVVLALFCVGLLHVI